MPPRTRPWASDGRFRVRMGQGERKVAFVGMRKISRTLVRVLGKSIRDSERDMRPE
jgi:hypothetical protein